MNQCKGDCEVTFENANGIFVKKGYSILNEFSLICNNYKAEFSELESVAQVNNWINKKTNKKIPSFLPNDYDITNVNLMLVNAIYFKGSWLNGFDEKTEKRDFKNFDGVKIQVDTMKHLFKDIYYYEDEKIQMISLPYQSTNLIYKMVIILPRDNKYSSSYDYLNKENVNFTKLISKLKKVDRVQLYLPKFEFNYNIQLNEVLKKMGMEKPFSSEEANFSKISKSKLFIDDILHQSKITVDQNGTVAVAITTFEIHEFSNNPNEIKELYYMYVNHSFIFLITSDSIKDSDYNNLITFLGTVNNLNSIKSENNLNLNNDKGNNYNNDKGNNDNNEQVVPKIHEMQFLGDRSLNKSENENGGKGVYSIKVYSLSLMFLIIML